MPQQGSGDLLGLVGARFDNVIDVTHARLARIPTRAVEHHFELVLQSRGRLEALNDVTVVMELTGQHTPGVEGLGNAVGDFVLLFFKGAKHAVPDDQHAVRMSHEILDCVALTQHSSCRCTLCCGRGARGDARAC